MKIDFSAIFKYNRTNLMHMECLSSMFFAASGSAGSCNNSTASGQPKHVFFLGQKLASVVDSKINGPARYHVRAEPVSHGYE